AVVYIEEEIIRRSRTIADAQVADLAALRTENAFAEPLPQLLLLADTPEPAWRNRIATALGLGERLDIAAVFIGAWSTTLTLAADGTTSHGDGHRVAVLDATGQPAPKLRAKSRELLVYLAVNRSGRSLSDIMEAIWPEATLSRAKERLSTCVANLRSVIRGVAAATMNIPDDAEESTRP